MPTNPNYDAYREALVVETTTVWPEDCGAVAPAEREPIARRLHADPQNVDRLEYVRLHAGFDLLEEILDSVAGEREVARAE